MTSASSPPPTHTHPPTFTPLAYDNAAALVHQAMLYVPSLLDALRLMLRVDLQFYYFY